ncbi:hypothetical protein Bbad01_26460 [Bacillus badius]|nr:hypothetical protein Bbad01_26460 [Bacillus badius]
MQDITEGKFLIFTDTKPIENEVEELIKRQDASENAILALMMNGGI